MAIFILILYCDNHLVEREDYEDEVGQEGKVEEMKYCKGEHKT